MLNINVFLQINSDSLALQLPRFTYSHLYQGWISMPVSLWWMLEQYGQPIGGRIDDKNLVLSIEEGAFLVHCSVSGKEMLLRVAPLLRQQLGWEEDIAVELELVANEHQHPQIRLRPC